MAYNYSSSWTEQKIFDVAEELVGKRLGEIDQTGWLKVKKNKGNIGNMIQADFFGIPANSIRGSDFLYHDIELKVTPVLKRKKVGYSSKERLVLGMIDYKKDYLIPYEKSIVNKKARSVLLVFYLHEENQMVEDFKVIKISRFRLLETDEKQVKDDYEEIIGKIKKGQAHKISERNQKILGACTKGKGKGKDLVNQPFAIQKAKTRAYSYKVGYMSAYFRKIFTPDEITHINITPKKSFIEIVEETLNRYIGKTDIEIQQDLKRTVNGKINCDTFLDRYITIYIN